ncbi:MAG: tetrathionate reductase family octaheme c-type cytochrome [Planctomycetota bacterium]
MQRRLDLLLLPVICLGLSVGAWALLRVEAPPAPPPRVALPLRAAPVSHAGFFAGPFESGSEVTQACLRCHQDAAKQVMQTAHWTWAGQHAVLPGQQAPTAIGKKNLINNFCISIAANWPRCTICHAGYGWDGPDFFAKAGEAQVDCLVCHDQSGQYVKGSAGQPAPGTDLLVAAKSVGRATRSNCGACHFAGGGGDAVKHGDLDGTMHHPAARIDVHMGRADLQCTACHGGAGHVIRGRILPLEEAPETRARCTDCHATAPHTSERLNAHLSAVSCEACHVPFIAIDAATKTSWDWSQAGQDPEQVAARDPEVAQDHHLYDKKKGRFTYARHVAPEYAWYDGTSTRYLPGQAIEPGAVVAIVRPNGKKDDGKARIWPFKVHRGQQPYDLQGKHLLTPQTYGKDGYWTTFDWKLAIERGTQASGLPFSGRYGWAKTEMAWPINHMVQRKQDALGCADCHGAQGRLDWRALGYAGDPAAGGGRWTGGAR